MAKKVMLFPFDESGNLLNEVSWDMELEENEVKQCIKDGEFRKENRYGRVVVWRTNREFMAEVQYDSYENRRSSTLMFVRDVNTGVKYPMFINEYDKLMKSPAGRNMTTIKSPSGESMTVIRGTFTYVKRGANYSLVWLR